MSTQDNDFFANITSLDNQTITEGLYEPKPPKIDLRPLPRHPAATEAPHYQTARTEEELQEKLSTLRSQMLPFLENHAPKRPSYRSSQQLTTFDWRIETKEDQTDFTSQVIEGQGQWTSLTIPHYGAPTGKATTFYRTNFHISPDDLAIGSTFACFKGVDYKAHVYINGAYAGSHEGFFAPFEFDITKWAKAGENTIVIRVDNDAINMGNRSWGNPEWEGDKLYGATGPGWDDPHAGWHHCPPGMGIYQDVKIEHRPTLFIHDIFVRPLPQDQQAEIWVEVYNASPLRKYADISYEIHGRNFNQPNIVSGTYAPKTRHKPGVGDMVKPNDNKILSLPCGPGVNYFKIPVNLPEPRIWTLDTPWLYQAHISLQDEHQQTIDNAEQHFGMRSFTSDEETIPKGRMFLNNEEIRLRGTNTMGNFQQCVMKKDWDQLIDDILLVKLCNLNFIRMTQRPVQPEIYDYYDMLGILSQSDFPLFGCLRRNQFDEALRQTREMERLLRSHPSCVIISYMNEPFPNGDSKPHRNLDFDEQRMWYNMADLTVRHTNPDRVIKAVDGDYDPPSPGVADRHCYNLWYGNHGIDFGKMHRGYWQVSKKDWGHGCGEFGVEGLDSAEVMHAHFPEEWMTVTNDEGQWIPDAIPYNQTYKFHHLWYETPREGLQQWIQKSHDYQKFALRHIGESFRRDNLCFTCAVHLFIDAFPSNWMKTIIDFHRKPKGGFFGIKEAFAPLAVSIRTDRFSWYPGEQFEAEAWLANDTTIRSDEYHLHYEVRDASGELFASGGDKATISPCHAAYQGNISLTIPEHITQRSVLSFSLTLIDPQGNAVHQSQQDITVFPRPEQNASSVSLFTSGNNSEATRMLKSLNIQASPSPDQAHTILCDNFSLFTEQHEHLLELTAKGKTLILLNIPNGKHEIAGTQLDVIPSGMAERHTLNRATGHPIVKDLKENDLRFLHDEDTGYITPFNRSCIMPTTDLIPILTTGTGNSGFGGPDEWIPVVAAGEIKHGKGSIIICQCDLGNRITTNSTAGTLAASLLNYQRNAPATATI